MKINDLEDKALWLRRELFEMAMRQKKGHIPSTYSCADLVTALYYGGVLKYKEGEPEYADRDRVIVSKGHAAMVLYPVLADIGYFPADELKRFTEPGGLLGMYADFRIPGIEGISGSLGHGLPMALGVALGMKASSSNGRVFVLVGDAELDEGSNHEAIAAAPRLGATNLTAIAIDNRSSSLGWRGGIAARFAGEGWSTADVDGRDHDAIRAALLAHSGDRPHTVVAHIDPGGS